MTTMPQSPAAYVAQSVASAAVASPQPVVSSQPQQQATAPAVATVAQPMTAAPVMAASMAPQGTAAAPQAAQSYAKKPRSRPSSGGSMPSAYDAKSGQSQQKTYSGAPGAVGYKGGANNNRAGYQHQLPHHATPQSSFVSTGGATAAVPIGGAMQPLMFAYPQQQQNAAQPAFGGSNSNGAAASYPQAYMPFTQPTQTAPTQQPHSMPAAGGMSAAPTATIAIGPNGQPLPPGAAGTAADVSLRKVIKVSSKSNVKSVAGAISHTTRAGESPTLMATGSESVNQAVKAIAIARGYLSENKLDVSCQPVFRNQEKGAITFVLTKGALRGKKPGEDDDIQQLRVARGSDPNSVAGSIANKVRNGERVLVQSIGAGSVDITVRAITLARRFLEGDAIDVCFRPEFIHVKLEEGERSAVKFTILAQQV